MPSQIFLCKQLYFSSWEKYLFNIFCVGQEIMVSLTVTGNRSEGEWSDIGSSRNDATTTTPAPPLRPPALRPNWI